MADFSSLSKPNDSAVEEIPSEVIFHTSLQQISGINSGSSSSVSMSNSWKEAKLPPEWEASARRPGSVSPPMSGCLCCSPRTKISRKKSFSVGRVNGDVLGKVGDGSMSRKDHEKIMMKAVMEEMKIVELALHASARMNSHT